MIKLENNSFCFAWDRIATRPYLCKQLNSELFYYGCYGEEKNDRRIFSKVDIKFPDLKDLNGWKLAYEIKPFTQDEYACSDDVLVYDSRSDYISECFYNLMDGWCDSESMGPYDNKRFKPNFWLPIPTIEEMEKLVSK